MTRARYLADFKQDDGTGYATKYATGFSPQFSGTPTGIVTGSIADGSITAAKVHADVATQTELDTVSTVANAALPKAGGTMTAATYGPAFIKTYGAQKWTSHGSPCGHPYIPYGGGYYTTLFYNSCGYGAMVGRIYITLDISQQHQGTYDFTLSRYGGGVSNRSSGAMNSYISLGSVGNLSGNANYTSLRWTNTNGNSWGNGTLRCDVIVWRGGDNCFVSGYPNLTDNFTSTQDGNGNFFHRVG